VQCRGDSEWAVVGRGQIHLGAARANQRRRGQQAADPAAARDLQAHGVRDAGRQRAGDRRGLVDRDPHRDALTQRAGIGKPVHRLLDQLEAVPGKRREDALGLLERPRTVGVQAQRRLCADRLAHGSHTLCVSRRADLELHARIAGGHRHRGGTRGEVGCVGGDARVHGDRLGRCVAEQLADRPPGAFARHVPQRHVYRRKRLGEVVDIAAAIKQRAAATPSARAGTRSGSGWRLEHRPVGLERRHRALDRNAVVGLERRRLAAPDEAAAVGQPQFDQLTAFERPMGSQEGLSEAKNDAIERELH
jgi:hypothetical protein